MNLHAWMPHFSLFLLLLLLLLEALQPIPIPAAAAATAAATAAAAAAEVSMEGRIASTTHTSADEFTGSSGEENGKFNVFAEALAAAMSPTPTPTPPPPPRFLVLLLTHDGLANRLRAMADWSIIGEHPVSVCV